MNRMQLGSRLVALVVLAVGLLSLARGVAAGPAVSDLTPEEARAVTGGAFPCWDPGTANCGSVIKTCGKTECLKTPGTGGGYIWQCPSTAEEDTIHDPYNSAISSKDGLNDRKVTNLIYCKTVYKCSYAGINNGSQPACWYDPADGLTKCNSNVSTVILRQENGVEVSEPSGADCGPP